MSVGPFSYTKDWTNNDPNHGFKAIETSETQARADIQYLFDEALDMINDVATAHNTDMPEALTTAEINEICV